jgi:hypothetical protein
MRCPLCILRDLRDFFLGHKEHHEARRTGRESGSCTEELQNPALLRSGTGVQGSDTTEADSSNAVGNKIILLNRLLN